MKRRIALFGITSLILLVYLLSTNPNQLSSAMLVVPFVLLFWMLYVAATFVMYVYGVKNPKRMRLGSIVALVPVLLLVLQSLGQLTVRDGLALFALLAVAYFYIMRFEPKSV